MKSTNKESQEFKDSDLLIYDRDGFFVHGINPKKVKSQGIDRETLEKIKEIYLERIDLTNLMKILDPSKDFSDLYECHKYAVMLNSQLQDLWGLSIDRSYFQFWKLPHCTCPKIDNDELYPSVNYHISRSCYHGMCLTSEGRKIKIPLSDIKIAEPKIEKHKFFSYRSLEVLGPRILRIALVLLLIKTLTEILPY